eukprot:354274-Chlamydomonas_euryale.AAC.1
MHDMLRCDMVENDMTRHGMIPHVKPMEFRPAVCAILQRASTGACTHPAWRPKSQIKDHCGCSASPRPHPR